MLRSKINVEERPTTVEYPSLVECKNNSGICLAIEDAGDGSRFRGVWVYWDTTDESLGLDVANRTFMLNKRDFKPFYGEVVLKNE